MNQIVGVKPAVFQRNVRCSPGRALRKGTPLGQGGYTMVELLVAVGMIAVVLALASPSLTQFVRGSRVNNAANDLLSAIIFARSEAIIRGRPVSIAAVGGIWQNGWSISVDPTRTPAAPTGTQLKVGGGVNKITTTSTHGVILFEPSGRRNLPLNGNLQMLSIIVDTNPLDANQRRRLCLPESGVNFIVPGSTACS